MLQETHLSDSEHLKLKRDWVGQSFFSTCKANTRKRGTVILIHKHFPFLLEHQISDPDGRHILITGTVYGEPFTITNIYAPNEDSPKFISKVILMFSQYCKGMGVCAREISTVSWTKKWTNPLPIHLLILDLLWLLKNSVMRLVSLMLGGNLIRVARSTLFTPILIALILE